MSKYQKCPKCGGETFDEVCLEWTAQGGVKIFTDGKVDHYEAGSTRLLNSFDFSKTYYKCEECGAELYFVDGQLTTEKGGK